MANQISSNPWILDTPGASIIFPSVVFVNFIEWFNPTNIGDTFELRNAQGKTILEGKAESAGGSQTFRIPNRFTGVQLQTLASGKIYIHVK